MEPPQVPKAWQAHRVLKTGVNKGYFGKTGCTKGFAEVIGVNAKTIKALGHEGQVRWLQRIFLVMERLWPVEVLGERWVPLELQTVEWASCEFMLIMLIMPLSPCRRPQPRPQQPSA